MLTAATQYGREPLFRGSPLSPEILHQRVKPENFCLIECHSKAVACCPANGSSKRNPAVAGIVIYACYAFTKAAEGEKIADLAAPLRLLQAPIGFTMAAVGKAAFVEEARGWWQTFCQFGLGVVVSETIGS